MTNVQTLLSLVAALITMVQGATNLPADVRMHALDVASQALMVIQAQATPPSAGVSIPVSPSVATTLDTNTTVDVSVSPAPQQTTQVATPPFVRSGSASLTAQLATDSVAMGSGRTLVATVSVRNATNETILFSASGGVKNILSSASSISGWSPAFFVTYRGDDLSGDTVGVKAGETGQVNIYLATAPATAGTFTFTLDRLQVAGVTSGDIFAVDGAPVQVGSVRVQ